MKNVILTRSLLLQESPKPDVEDGRYEVESASSNEKQVENGNGSEQRTSPSVESSCSGSSGSPPELATDGCNAVSSTVPHALCSVVSGELKPRFPAFFLHLFLS